MPREQAEQTARREFGNVTLLRERSREEWQWSRVESILADIKYTFRRLRRSPGFAATVLLTLAIGIGANDSGREFGWLRGCDAYGGHRSELG